MVEKIVKICDVCNEGVAKTTCPVCDKDICPNCLDELEAGTVVFEPCEDCSTKMEKIAKRGKDFWEEFNKNEGMEKKIITYFKKKMIVENLDESEDDDDDDDVLSEFRRKKRKRAKVRRRKWGTETMDMDVKGGI